MPTKKVEKNINIRPPKGENFDKRIKVILKKHRLLFKNRNAFIISAIKEHLRHYEGVA